MKIFNGAVAVCAGLTAVNYAIYLIKLIVVPEQPTAYILTFLILGGVLLPFIFRRQLSRGFPRLYKIGKAIYGGCVIFYAVTFTVMCSVIFFGKTAETPVQQLPRDTVFVVYGAKVSGDAEHSYPGKSLTLRLEKAVQLMEELPDSVCIVTGGQGPDEYRPEGEVMAEYLESRGIDPRRIYVDATSKNTLENIENAMTLIENEALEDRSVACISTGFHIPRIRLLCDRAGLDAEYFYYAKAPNAATLYPSLVREYMSWGKLILTGHL